MPNSGSGDPTDPLGPIGPGRPGTLTPHEPIAGPQGAGSVEGPSAAPSASPADRASGPMDTEAIASALSHGTLDAAQARAQLIDQAVQAQLPPDAAPETIAAIRAEVEALLAGDPVLERLLQP